MSEYQYYEFQAIDRALTEREMKALRALSSRALITPTSFVNTYNYGDFRGDPARLMEKYYDAFVYLANWGTREFMLRLPSPLLDVKKLSEFCAGEGCQAKAKGQNVILSIRSDCPEGGDWEEGEGWLTSLIPLRADLLRGDFRAVYLGWLLCAQSEELDDNGFEPAPPPGLRELTPPLKSLAAFLRVDGDLIGAAADRSGPDAPRRTVAELLAAGEARAEARQKRRQRAQAAARTKYLNALAKQEPETWQKVEALIGTKRQSDYDQAVELLKDLAELGAHSGRASEFAERIRELRERHSTKPSFMRRLAEAGLGKPS